MRPAAAHRRALAAMLGLLPFAAAYGLIYWGEQYVPSGLAAVLFGVMPLYSAMLAAFVLPDEPLRAAAAARDRDRARAGSSLAFGESLDARRRRVRGARRDRRARSRRWRARSATSRSSAARSGSTRSCSTAGRCSAAAPCCSSRLPTEDWGDGDLDRAPRSARSSTSPRSARLDVRDADDPAARAARGDGVVHHAAAPVRRARVRRRCCTTRRSRPRRSAAPCWSRVA